MTKGKSMVVNLKVEKKTRDDGKIQLAITAPAATIGDVVKNAAFVLAMQNRIDLKDVNMDELEPVVIEKVGEAQYNAFINHFAMSALAPHAITQAKIEPIMEPEFNASGQIAKGREFSFVAVVTPKPRFELSSYDPVTVKLPPITITEEEIDAQLLNMADRYATIEPDEGAAVSKDSEVTFAIKTVSKDDNEPLPQLTADHRVYQLGQGYLPQDFDENLIGMKAGESKTFDFGLPLAYNPDGTPNGTSTATATIDLTQVNRRVIPAINDAWVKENMPEAKNVDGLREMLRGQGMEYKKSEQENMKFYLTASALAQRFQGFIPDEIYEFTRGDMLANMSEQLKQQGMTLEQYVQSMGMEMQQFNMSIMMQVRETLRQSFALDALARQRKISLNEEDILDTLSRMAPGNEERMRAELEGTGRAYLLTEAAIRTKANKWLVETATFESAG